MLNICVREYYNQSFVGGLMFLNADEAVEIVYKLLKAVLERK